MNALNIAGAIVIGALIALCIFLGLKWNEQRQSVKHLQQQLESCENTPPVIDTIIRHDTITINLVKVIAKTKTDTMYLDGRLQVVNVYKDTLFTKDFDLTYQARTIGVLKDIAFPSYVLHTPEVTITKTVVRDTTITREVYKAKNHWILEGALFGSNVTQFPGIDLGVSYSIKDRFKINAGGMYDSYHATGFVKVGFGLYLN